MKNSKLENMTPTKMKFTVEITSRMTEIAFFDVEAKTEKEAKQKADALADVSNSDEWELVVYYRSYEVVID